MRLRNCLFICFLAKTQILQNTVYSFHKLINVHEYFQITTTKLEWNAKSKIGSLQNAAYKPGGGDKKIETVKLDFKEKAKPKVASTVNITHKPGGGAIKVTWNLNTNLSIKFHVLKVIGIYTTIISVSIQNRI